MNKIRYIYKLIGTNLILGKYKVDVDYIMEGKNDISKKTLFKDIKKGLKHLTSVGIIDNGEYKMVLSTIKTNIKNSDTFISAVKPFLIAAASSTKDDTLGD